MSTGGALAITVQCPGINLRTKPGKVRGQFILHLWSLARLPTRLRT